jgi:hypothetical protein
MNSQVSVTLEATCDWKKWALGQTFDYLMDREPSLLHIIMDYMLCKGFLSM